MFGDLFQRAFWTSDMICGAAGVVLAAAGAVFAFVVGHGLMGEALGARMAGEAARDQAALIERVGYHYEQLRAQTQAIDIVLDAAPDAARARTQRLAVLDTRAFQVTRLLEFAFAPEERDRVFAAYQRDIDAYARGDEAALARIMDLEAETVQRAVGTREALVRDARAQSGEAERLTLLARLSEQGGGALMLGGFLLAVLGVIIRRRLDDYY